MRTTMSSKEINEKIISIIISFTYPRFCLNKLITFSLSKYMTYLVLNIRKIPNKSLPISKRTSEEPKLPKGTMKEPTPTYHFKILRKDKIAPMLKHTLQEEDEFRV